VEDALPLLDVGDALPDATIRAGIRRQCGRIIINRPRSSRF
jgi:hypothetical protein